MWPADAPFLGLVSGGGPPRAHNRLRRTSPFKTGLIGQDTPKEAHGRLRAPRDSGHLGQKKNRERPLRTSVNSQDEAPSVSAPTRARKSYLHRAASRQHVSTTAHLTDAAILRQHLIAAHPLSWFLCVRPNRSARLRAHSYFCAHSKTRTLMDGKWDDGRQQGRAC